MPDAGLRIGEAAGAQLLCTLLPRRGLNMPVAPLRVTTPMVMAMMLAAMMARVEMMMPVRVTRYTVMTIGLC